jgi:hypothetical protein
MVADLSDSATEMKTQAGSMTDTAGHTVQQATNVAAAEQASVNVQTVASAEEGRPQSTRSLVVRSPNRRRSPAKRRTTRRGPMAWCAR